MYGVIYKITNLLNGKPYVGQTTRSIEVRFHEHGRTNFPIGKAIRKYGAENFSIEVLEECETREQLNEHEKFWIAELNCMAPNGYNLTGGGEGQILSPELIFKRSANATRMWASKSKEERSLIAKEREARKSPEKRSESARKANATRNKTLANRTPEEKAAESARRSKAMKKSWAKKSDEEKAEFNKAKKERIAAKTSEERRQMIEAALEASKKRTHEDRSEAVRKGRARMSQEARSACARKAWETKRAKKKQKLICKLIELIKNFVGE